VKRQGSSRECHSEVTARRFQIAQFIRSCFGTASARFGHFVVRLLAKSEADNRWRGMVRAS
jgi:hypothetical protein